MKVINLTPHDIVVWHECTERRYKASGTIARVRQEHEVVGSIDGVPIVRTIMGDIENLPPPQPQTVYLVSNMVLQHAKGRYDLLAPDTGPTAFRGDNGQIVAVRNFISYASYPERD